jgi:hypothetical protein
VTSSFSPPRLPIVGKVISASPSVSPPPSSPDVWEIHKTHAPWPHVVLTFPATCMKLIFLLK